MSLSLERTPWWEEFENSMACRWLQKPILERRPLPLTRSLRDWTVEGIARIAIARDNTFDGQPSFRFQTPMRDEAFLRQERNSLGSFSGESGGGTSAILRFDPPEDWSAYNRIAAWVYVHPVQMQRVALNLQLEPNFRAPLPPYDFISYPRPTFHAQHLVQEQWNLVLWEIPDFPRQAITGFVLSQELFGCEPGAGGMVTYDIGPVELQRVEAEKYEGWEVAPGRIAYSHCGYLPRQRKVALASGLEAAVFQVRHAYTGEVVLTRPVRPFTTPQGSFQELDFSDLPEGAYRLQAGEILTRPFIVGEDLWRDAILKLLNFYFCQRCGYPVPGLHAACHQDVFGVHGDVKKPINGGWHDAADFSQGCHQTGLSIYAMLSLARQFRLHQTETILEGQLLEEARWGLEWLLKTRFGQGYRIAFQTARIYTDNAPNTVDDILVAAHNVPFLNLLCAAVEALAYESYGEKDPAFAGECLRCAREDWQAGTAAAGQDLLTAAWGVVASTHLHRITGEARCQEKALAYGRVVLDCQERSFLGGIRLTGFFYRDPSRAEIAHYNHLGFEESPLLALSSLCRAYPDHPDAIQWYAAAAIHAETLQKRGAETTAPYFMLANGVYRLGEFDGTGQSGEEGAPNAGLDQPEENRPGRAASREKLRQVKEGVALGGDFYLKRFPAWENELFRGATGVQLSQALALALAADLRADLRGETLALRQLQWVIGFNPFCQSLMYGEGYDYLSLHAHRQMDMVGALPVGMDCRSGDQPYWSPSNFATQKEIWVVPASRFLWSLAYLNIPARVTGRVENPLKNKRVIFQNMDTGKTTYLRPDAGGRFAGSLPSGEYQVRYGKLRRAIVLTSGSQVDLPLDPGWFVDFEVKAITAKKPGPGKTGAAAGVALPLPTTVRLLLVASGAGRHSFELRLFNARLVSAQPAAELEPDSPEAIPLDLEIEDPHTPWLALVVPDGQMAWAKEIFGAGE